MHCCSPRLRCCSYKSSAVVVYDLVISDRRGWCFAPHTYPVRLRILFSMRTVEIFWLVVERQTQQRHKSRRLCLMSAVERNYWLIQLVLSVQHLSLFVPPFRTRACAAWFTAYKPRARAPREVRDGEREVANTDNSWAVLFSSHECLLLCVFVESSIRWFGSLRLLRTQGLGETTPQKNAGGLLSQHDIKRSRCCSAPSVGTTAVCCLGLR